jgi:hypothetical protein
MLKQQGIDNTRRPPRGGRVIDDRRTAKRREDENIQIVLVVMSSGVGSGLTGRGLA